MGIIHGKDIKILSGSGALIAKAKSCTSTDGVSLVEGQTYSISVVVGSAATWTGSVICTDCEVSAPMNNLSQGTIKLLGNGPLSTGT